MKVLFLSPYTDFETPPGDIFYRMDLPITNVSGYDYIVSYGYRHIISEDILKQINYKAINLHISYLPWNRGADPNLWSFLDNTPKGVTIHKIDKGLDTGYILVQSLIPVFVDDTLKTVYDRLHRRLRELFYIYWDDIKNNKIRGLPQHTYHRSDDKKYIMKLFPKGWDTPIQTIQDMKYCTVKVDSELTDNYFIYTKFKE